MTTEEKVNGPINQVLRTYRNKENLQKSYLPGIHRIKQSSIQAQQYARDHSFSNDPKPQIEKRERSQSSSQHIVVSLNNAMEAQRQEIIKNHIFQQNYMEKDTNQKRSRLSISQNTKLNEGVDLNRNILSQNISPTNPISIEPHETMGSKQNIQTINQDQLSKKKLKGPNSLNIKVLEMWINDTILEAETGDPKAQNGQQKVIKKSALKQFSIDRKNLKTKGISMENIDRMYRCLFVYSFGFYEMLYSIFNHAQDQSMLIANIWKVYGILLEYCSRSDFQATISVIEKEKKVFVTQLETQISRKEKQIAEMENRDKQERERLQTELKALLLQRENLQIEKSQIEEDFKQADQAFNEELSLRLKFEHRINEIHSIHREVLAQHNRLLLDHQQLQEDYAKAQNEIIDFKEKIIQLLNSKNLLEEEVRQKDLALQHKNKENEIIQDKLKLISRQIDDKKLIDDTKVNIIKEIERNVEDLKFKSNNLQNQLSIHKKTIKDLEEQILDLQQDKENFNLKIKELQKINEDLRSNIYELEQQLVVHRRDIENHKEKQEEQKQIHRKLDNQYMRLMSDKKQLEVDLDFSKQRIAIQDSDIKAMEQVILDMKIARNELEDQYVKLKLKLENTQEQLTVKSDFCKLQEIQLNERHIVNYKLQIEVNQLKDYSSNEIDALTKKLNILQASYRDKVLEFDKKTEELERIRVNYLKVLNESETLRINFQDCKQDLKNQTFVSDNNTQQMNSLKSILESERLRIDCFVEQIGKLQIQNEQLSRDYKSISFVSREQQEHYENHISKMQERYSIEIKKIKGDYTSIHAMHYEDLSGYLQKSIEKYDNLQKEYYQLSEKYDLEIENRKQIEIEKNSLEYEIMQINKLSNKRNKIINTLVVRQKHLSFLKERNQMAVQEDFDTIHKLLNDNQQQKIKIDDLLAQISELKNLQLKNEELIQQIQQKNDDIEQINLQQVVLQDQFFNKNEYSPQAQENIDSNFGREIQEQKPLITQSSKNEQQELKLPTRKPPNPPKYQTFQPDYKPHTASDNSSRPIQSVHSSQNQVDPHNPQIDLQNQSQSNPNTTKSNQLHRQFSNPEEEKQQYNTDFKQSKIPQTASYMERRIHSSGRSERDKKGMNPNAFSRQFQITSQYYSGIKKI